jgi:hypothetical protein
LNRAMLVLFLFFSFSFAEISGDIIAGYLDMMGEEMVYERMENQFVLLATTEDGTQVPYMFVFVEPESEACLLVALTPGVVPESGPERQQALETITQLNWDNTWARYTVEPETGEVSIMYPFTTENGLGYESFTTMINVMLGSVDENWEILSSM